VNNSAVGENIAGGLPPRLDHGPNLATLRGLIGDYRSLVKMLFALENQLSEYRKRIEELFESHPDHDPYLALDPSLLPC
jgi:hypothetical protein